MWYTEMNITVRNEKHIGDYSPWNMKVMKTKKS